MRRTAIFVGFTAILAITMLGCQSHQAKVDVLQKKYDQLGKQFQQDCSAEYFKVPPTLSTKCSAEKQNLDATLAQLQAERAKK
jgi:uncharacterized lipoprotein NlpE involved in copper resistance